MHSPKLAGRERELPQALRSDATGSSLMVRVMLQPVFPLEEGLVVLLLLPM